MMGWLFQNPVANLPGPWFLMLFAVVAVSGLIAAGVILMLFDETRDRENLAVPAAPDPYEIAYLRGGTPEVTRLAVFDLLQRRVIELADKEKWLGVLAQGKELKRGSVQLDSSRDGSLLLVAGSWFNTSRKPEEIYGKSDSLVKQLEPLCESYESRLKERDLLETDGHQSTRHFAGGVLTVGLLGLAAFKSTAAVMTGHFNVGFLILFTVASLIGTAVVCRKKRLSHLGRRYLKQLQLAFASLKSVGKYPTSNSSTEEQGMNPALLVAMGLFGIVVLKESAYADFYKTYERATATGGGCGSGCGSSGGGGCGGGGCGGGCGGCGGG